MVAKAPALPFVGVLTGELIGVRTIFLCFVAEKVGDGVTAAAVEEESEMERVLLGVVTTEVNLLPISAASGRKGVF